MSREKNVKIFSKSAKETSDIAGKFIDNIIKNKRSDKACVVLLNGNLGAGKTTFTIGVLNYFGIYPHNASPTFVIMKKYKTNNDNIKFIYHIDAYRMKSFEDIKTIGLDEIVSDPDNLALIEWPKNIKDYHFKDPKKIDFDYGNDKDERLITFLN